jgi:hypothetical protein
MGPVHARWYRDLQLRVINASDASGGIAMADKYSHDDLVKKVKSPGWRLVTGKKDAAHTGTLEHLLHLSHKKKGTGESPGLIQEIETSIELDMLQIAQLWRYLGLPV